MDKRRLLLKSERIDYNLHLTPTQLIQRPDTTQVTWLPAHAPEIQAPVRLKKLKNETAPEAAQRVLKALTDGKPQMAGEALYYYTASLPTLSEDLKGCKASDFSEAKEKKRLQRSHRVLQVDTLRWQFCNPSHSLAP